MLWWELTHLQFDWEYFVCFILNRFSKHIHVLFIWSYGEVVITLACHAKVSSSILDNSAIYAVLAQLVVQLICNQQVVGSSPTGSL